MGNVWKAMRKHQAEEAAKAPQAAEVADPAAPPEKGSAPAPAGDSVAEARPDKPEAEPKEPWSAATRNGRYSELLLAYHNPGASITEEYRSARISLIAQAGDEKLCCLITSSASGEGKTVTCANLGVVLAEREDRRTILIDGDLRKASLAKLFHADNSPGVADVLRGANSVAEATRETVCRNLFLMPAGKTNMQEVGELLARPELEDMIRQLRREYDYVLFDTPPINKAPDAGMIGRFAGEAIVVIRMNKTPRESVETAIRLLHAAQVEMNGIILTHRTFQIPHYLYRYS